MTDNIDKTKNTPPVYLMKSTIQQDFERRSGGGFPLPIPGVTASGAYVPTPTGEWSHDEAAPLTYNRLANDYGVEAAVIPVVTDPAPGEGLTLPTFGELADHFGLPESVRVSILSEAATIVSKDRRDTYGNPEDSFKTIGQLWSVLFGIPIEGWQVALAMDLLKTARIMSNPTHRDSWVDKAGYSGCGAESAGVS